MLVKTTKICTKCKSEKNITEFGKRSKSKDGLSPSCTKCRRKVAFNYYKNNAEKATKATRKWQADNPEKTQNAGWKKQGIKNKDGSWFTKNNYLAILMFQNNRCALCGTSTPGRNNLRWCVDHDHKTGVVRGLLCHSCNNALGHFKDDIDVLSTAIKYLSQNL